jgi:hypothetical protein
MNGMTAAKIQLNLTRIEEFLLEEFSDGFGGKSFYLRHKR